MYCILIYDIKNDEISTYRSRNVFNIAKKYLIHIQKSIFEGEITEVQYTKLIKNLKEFLSYDDDSCIMFTSRNKKWMTKRFITKKNDDTSNFL